MACISRYSEDKTIMQNIYNIRNSSGYKGVFNEIFNNLLPSSYCEILNYIKFTLEIDDSTFEEVVGIKELTPEIWSPGGYNQTEDFILLFHLLMVLTSDEYNEEQNNFIIKFGKRFNYSIDQIQFIINSSVPLLQMIDDFEGIKKVEQKVLQEFLIKYLKLPQPSHG